MALALLARVGARYVALLETRPLATKSLTAAAIAAAGDVLCQKLAPPDQATVTRSLKRARSADVEAPNCGDEVHPRPPAPGLWRWDAARTARMGGYALAVTPAVHYWYAGLARTFPSSPLKRMLSDQLLWTPATLALFLATMGALEVGGSGAAGAAAAAGAKLRGCFWAVLRNNYVLWPAVQYVNLGFVPQKYQILVANVVGLAWAVYLSSVVNASAGAGAGSGGRPCEGGGGGRAPDPFEAPAPGTGASRRYEVGEAALESSLVKASSVVIDVTARGSGAGRCYAGTGTAVSTSRPRVHAAGAFEL